MYSTDVPKIKQKVDLHPLYLVSVITFVLCTIRTPISRVYPQVLEVSREGTKATSLWGFKRKGFEYALKNWSPLYESYKTGDRESFLLSLLKVPGLGLPKASFVAQCVGFSTACLDSHNLKRLGLPVSVTQFKGLDSLREYLTITDERGAEWYWNSWCEYVSDNRMNRGLTPEDISGIHSKSIVWVLNRR